MRSLNPNRVAEDGRLAGGQERGCCSVERKPEARAVGSMDRNVNPQDIPFMAEGYSSSSLDPCRGFMPSDMEEPSEVHSCGNPGEDNGFDFDTCPVGFPIHP